MARGGKRQGAGRPKAPHTIQAEAFRAFLIKEVVSEQAPIVTALIKKAKLGDVPALKEVLERVLGKSIPLLDPEDLMTLPFQLIIKQKDG